MTPTVAVVGDVMLDEYLIGQVNRISPEAPVPVHLVTETLHRPGGAANAALNIQTLGGKAKLFSVVGKDQAGQELKALLKREGIDEEFVLQAMDRPTIRKTRVTSGVQQLIRVDWEKSVSVPHHLIENLVTALDQTKFDAILISDYGKGLLTDAFLRQIIAIAQSKGVLVVVDPKRKDLSCYSGAHLITPNRKEACEALDLDPDGPEAGAVLASGLQSRYGFENILVTLGPKGMILLKPQKEPVPGQSILSLKALAREVFDVSGAGDTVAAVMGLCLACGESLEEGAILANAAAAIAVGKVGTQPVYAEELILALNQGRVGAIGGGGVQWGQGRKALKKVVDIESLFKKIPFLASIPQERRLKVVFTNGCFDILHAGHVSYLELAKEQGDILIVGINSDESIRRIKGAERPIVGLTERMMLLAGLESVDFVIPFSENTPENLIRKIVPDILIKGGDYRVDAAQGDAQEIIGGEYVRSKGGKVQTIPLVPGISTSDIIGRILRIHRIGMSAKSDSSK